MTNTQVAKTYTTSRMNPLARTKWPSERKQWVHDVRIFTMGTLSESLHNPLLTFMDAFRLPKLPIFYLLAKSHKSTTIRKGRWPSRAVVGLHQWATTFSSIILSTFSIILLCLEKNMDALNAPFIDSLDFVTKLRQLSSRRHVRDLHTTSIDFSAS